MQNKREPLTDRDLRSHLVALYSGVRDIHQQLEELELTRDALLETLRDSGPELLHEYSAKLTALKTDAVQNRGCMQTTDAIQLNIDRLEGKETK
jgi:hypothetical protein